MKPSSSVSEAKTMQLFKRETLMPIPGIFGYGLTLDIELNCPYMLLEFIGGKALSDCRFDESVSQDILEQRRFITLQDVASAMAQLDKMCIPALWTVHI